MSFDDDERPVVLLISHERSVCSTVHTLSPSELCVVEALDASDLKCIEPGIRSRIILIYADVSGENDDAADFWTELKRVQWLKLSKTVAICHEDNLKQLITAASAGVADVFTAPLDSAGFKRRSEKLLKANGGIQTMNQLLLKLKDMDAEVEDTLDRLMGDEEMYVEQLRKLPQNENILALQKAVAEKDNERAEREVHTLKGVALNLGLLPLVDVCMDMLLELRAGNPEAAYEMLPEVVDTFQQWKTVIEKDAKE